MLNYLHIENIAVIESADLTLSGGFNVLTGETGAGKSIIIDSINAVLGARTSKELIRNGCEAAKVIAEFSEICKETEALIESFGYNLEDGKLIIQRILTHDSRGGFRINGLPATASVVREIGINLINIHGQHDNQMLLNPEKHCHYIDKIAENNAEISEYFKEFKILNSIRRELNSLDMDEEEKLRKIDLLSYQITELENADIKIGEYENLRQQLKIAKQFEKNKERINSVLAALNGEEDSGAIETLSTAIKMLNQVDSNKLNPAVQKLNAALEDICDSEAEIRFFADNDLANIENINLIQDRIDLLHSLMLKYSNSEEKLLEFLDNAKVELNEINLSTDKAKKLEEELFESEKRLIKNAEKLSKTRLMAAKKFEREVGETLKYLDMPNVVFKVDIQKGKYSKNGCDVIEFMISANAGESVKPLAKIASGGELSRVMLAIKSVLSAVDEVSTLIFDEIDAGISGRAANKVAVQLKKVAKARQVVCVTHLAQIAAFADNHMLIEKKVSAGRTFTDIYSLDYKNRIDEIARIMSGTEITEKLFDSAKELLDRSINYGNL